MSMDIEKLAAAEHESWSGWTRYMLDRQRRELGSAIILDAEGIPEEGRAAFARTVLDVFDKLPSTVRWSRQMATPYEELPEEEKESDRKEAREKMKVYRPLDRRANYPYWSEEDVRLDAERAAKRRLERTE